MHLLNPQERVAEAFAGGFFQLFAHRGVGDGDQRTGALGEVAAPQVRHAVFGDHVLDHVAGRDDARAGRQQRLIFDSPFGVVEGMAMKVLPPSESAPPYMKSC